MASSCRSLWKVLAGQLSVRDTNLLIAEVKACKEKLSSGLDFYKPPSRETESKLCSTLKGVRLDFIIELSKCLSLHQQQCLNLFEQFLLDDYRGSIGDLKNVLSTKNDRTQLCLCVQSYYHQERLYALRCVKHLLGYWQDGSHPFRDVFAECLKLIELESATFTSRLWKQFEACATAEVPSHIVSSEDEMKWSHQNMLEQCELLEMLLLFYKDYEFSPNDLVTKMALCLKIGFTQHKHRTIQPLHDNLHTHISHLCCLVLLEGIDIEWILQNENRPTEILKHHLLLPKASSCLEELLEVLQKADSAIHTPLLLALMVLKFVSSKEEEDVECVQLLGHRALDGGVFEQLLAIMESSFLSGYRPVAEVCRCVVHALLYMVVSLFSEDSLGDLKILVEIAGKTLQHPTLRIAFWEKGENGAIYMLLGSILKRFPVEFSSVVSLLLPLAMDQYSAHKLHSLLCRVSWYAESASSHGLEGCVQSGDQEGTVVLTRGKELYRQECFSVGVPSLVLSAGTVGLLIGSEETDQVISWSHQYSAWDLLAAITAQLLHTPGVGVDPIGHPITHSVTLIFKLVTELLKHDHSLHTALQPITGQLTHILTKLSSLPYPPTDLIAGCLECAAVMASYNTHHIWPRLSRTRFFPQIIGTTKKAESLQLIPGHYGHLHNVWERAHGSYGVTMAMIQLLQSTIDAIHTPDRVTEASSHVTTASDHMTTDRTVLATAVYVLREGLTSSHGWRYQSHSDREQLCKKLLELCLVILQHGSDETAENSDFNSQNYLYQYASSLLLHSNGHALLVSILAIGVDTVNGLMSSSSMVQCPVAVDTLKLSFSIIDLVLQQDKLPQQTVSHLEKALATRTITTTVSCSQHLIAVVAGYIHHHSDHGVPIGATRLLARLATAATISVYSCLGQEAVAIRDRFINRMSAHSENFQLKMAILQFIKSLIGTQPGLLELFLYVRTPLDKKADKSIKGPGAKEQGGEQEKPPGYDLAPESCLCAVLSLLDPSKQSPPPPLLSAALSLLHTLWQVRHNTALSALRSSHASFWKNLSSSLFKPPDLQSLKKEDEADATGCLDSAAHILNIIGTELYYVLEHSVDKGLVEVIRELIKADFYLKWCKVLCSAKLRGECDGQEEEGEEGVMSAAVLSSQRQLAEGWQALLLVAATHHVELFQLNSSGSHRSTILLGLLDAISSQVTCLPHSIDILSVLTTTHSVLLHKWSSEMKFTCSTIDQLSGVLERVCQCDTLTCWQSVLPHLYSALLVVFRSMRGAGGNLEPRFVATLLPPVVSTLLRYPSYSSYLPSDGKHNPETLCVHLLSEITSSLPEDSSAWLQAMRHHSLIAMVMRIADELTRSLTRPDLVEAILCYSLSLSSSPAAAEALVVNGLSRVVCLPMANMVAVKLSSTSESKDMFNGGGVCGGMSLPPMDWFRVWLTALHLVTRLLSTLRHNYLPHALNFMGANQERIAQCLDIFETTRHMDSLNETMSVCSLVQELAHYRQQWRLSLSHFHDLVIEKLLVLLSGTVSLLNKRNNLKHIIKTMDSRGLLPAEVIHEALKVRGKRRSSSGFGQYTFSSDDDSWIICSSAYQQLQDNLLAIMTSCLTTLNHYSPPVADLFMCSFAHPVDLSAWHSLFRLNFIMDPTCSPSLATLTQSLSVGVTLLNKLEGHRSGSAHGLLSKSPSSVSPIRSPNTPGLLLRSSGVSTQQKRSEILFMLEQAVILLMSQSLKCLLDGEEGGGMNAREKQILRKELVSELSNFNQSLLFNFTRKGAPSPLSSHRTPFSASGQSLQDSVSGRASTHSFSDSIEQGIFKLADSFAKSLNR